MTLQSYQKKRFFLHPPLVDNLNTHPVSSLPTILTMLVELSSPAELSAVHVYRALSSSPASLIINEPSSCTLYLLPLGISWPSFVHVTDGFGTPVVGHLMVILVLVSAVILSPMFKVMGFRS